MPQPGGGHIEILPFGGGVVGPQRQMSFVVLTPEIVEALHDAALNLGELEGRAMDKSLESLVSAGHYFDAPFAPGDGLHVDYMLLTCGLQFAFVVCPLFGNNSCTM